MLKSLNYETETLKACPVCGSSRVKHWLKGPDRDYRLTDSVFLFDRCRDCSVHFLNPRPKESDVAQFYPSDYAPYQTGAKSSFLEKLKRGKGEVPLIVKCLAKYAETMPADAVAVDFGCGSNALLDLMRDLGWKTIGMDIAPATIKKIEESGHRGILLRSLEDFDALDDNSVHLFVLNHVFEHLYHPRKVLAQLRRKLVRNGILHIAVPNPEGLSARLFRSYWFGLSAPRHPHLYPMETLVRLLKESGFACEDTYPEMITKDMARSLGYMAQGMGFLKNTPMEKLVQSKTLNKVLRRPCSLAARRGLADRFQVAGVKCSD